MPNPTAPGATSWLDCHDSILPPATARGDFDAGEIQKLDAALTAIGQTLDTCNREDIATFARRLRLEPVRSRLSPGLVSLEDRRISHYFLAWIAQPGHPARHAFLAVLLETEQDSSARPLHSAIRDHNRRALASRMFSNTRIETLLAACGAATPTRH